MRDYLFFYLNGAPKRVSGALAFESLSRYLRGDQRATGTKIVCEEGDCGACTVMIGRREDGRMRYRAVNSCIQFLFQLDCTHIITVEGLQRGEQLHEVQSAMATCHGAQCGYCTPGFIVAMAAMAEEGERDARRALTGNLCRCTGYEPIIKAADQCDFDRMERLDSRYPTPPDLAARERDSVRIDHFFKPATLAEAIEFKAANPGCVIVQGATDFGVWCNKRGFTAKSVMSLSAVEGLDELRIEGDELLVGARVTLANLEKFVAGRIPSLAPILDRFGSPQIKNAGTLAGNIANASPIADSLPFLYVSGARLQLTGASGTREVDIAAFYRGYKTLDLAPDELITKIIIPMPRETETLRLYKVSKRSHLDISSFTAAVSMRRDGDRIGAVRIAYGGVGPLVLRLPRTESFLAGRAFDLDGMSQAGVLAREEITPIDDVRGSREFRLQLAENILTRFYYDVTSGATA